MHWLLALLPEGEAGVQAFRIRGYQTRDLVYFERIVPLQQREVGRLETLAVTCSRTICGTPRPA